MDGKVVIVTGASGALGGVVAEQALSRGARVAGVDHAVSQAVAAANRIELGGVDLTDAAQAKKAIDHAAAHFGRLDVLINIAGGFAFEAVAEGDTKNLAAHVRTQPVDRAERVAGGVAASFGLAGRPDCQCRRDGRVAGGRRHGTLCGVQSGRAPPHPPHSEALAAEWKGKLTVNAVLPSTIDTPAKPRQHAESGFQEMGRAGRTVERDPVPRKRCRERHHGCAIAGQRTRLTFDVFSSRKPVPTSVENALQRFSERRAITRPNSVRLRTLSRGLRRWSLAVGNRAVSPPSNASLRSSALRSRARSAAVISWA